MGENHLTALNGFVLLMSAIAYFVLQGRILAAEPPSSKLRTEIGADFKGKLSVALYIAGVISAFYASWLACTFYAFVAVLWLTPDRRVERAVVRKREM